MAAPLNLNTLTFPQSAVRTSGLQPHDNIDDKLDTIIASTGAIADVKATTNTIKATTDTIKTNLNTVSNSVGGVGTQATTIDGKVDTLVTDVAAIKAATVTP